MVDLVVVAERCPRIDRERGKRLAVENRRRLREPVEVDGVRIEQVGPHHHAHVGQVQVEALAFLERDRRRGDLGLQHAVAHDGLPNLVRVRIQHRQRRMVWSAKPNV